MHVYDYVMKSCKMVRNWSETDGRKFSNKRKDSMKAKYCPEIDISDEFGYELAARFQLMIGILLWLTEL